MKRLLCFTIVLTALAAQAWAVGSIRLSVKDTTVVRGSTFYYAVVADSDFTGLGVTSYELTLTFDQNSFRIDSIIADGTLSASWGAPTYNATTNRVSIAGAGTSPLAGTGVLVYLRIATPIWLTGGGSGFTFTHVLFNEGTPPAIFRNGTVWITNPPTITISPDDGTPTVGETMQFHVSGGTSPYQWTTTNPLVASIDTNGLLTAVHNGTCRVAVRDHNGYVDTSAAVNVRAFRLVLRDTSFLQSQTFLYPIYVTDLSLVDVLSGQFTLTFNQNLLTALGTAEMGTLLQPYGSSTALISPSQINLSFAGTSRLDGVGMQVLVYVQFRATSATYGGTGMTLSAALFNQDLLGNVRNANLTVNNRAILGVNPNTSSLVAGDSVHFSASGGATPPLTWSVSDTSLASISDDGWLHAKKGGTVYVSVQDAIGATGTSGAISLYDVWVRVVNSNAQQGDTVIVPLNVDAFASGITAVQCVVGYNANYFTPVSLETANSGWTGDFNITTPGTLSMAEISTDGITNAATLVKIYFAIDPATPPGSYQVTLSNVVLNEGRPLGRPSNGTISVSAMSVNELGGVPETFALLQNYPNPFNPSTEIRYRIPEARWVTLKIFDVLGREITTLVDGVKQPGTYSVQWNAEGLISGVYFYRLAAGDFEATRELLLLR